MHVKLGLKNLVSVSVKAKTRLYPVLTLVQSIYIPKNLSCSDLEPTNQLLRLASSAEWHHLVLVAAGVHCPVPSTSDSRR